MLWFSFFTLILEEGFQYYLMTSLLEVESFRFNLLKDQVLSLWSGGTDSKTIDYQRTPNPREYQIVRTPTKETT